MAGRPLKRARLKREARRARQNPSKHGWPQKVGPWTLKQAISPLKAVYTAIEPHYPGEPPWEVEVAPADPTAVLEIGSRLTAAGDVVDVCAEGKVGDWAIHVLDDPEGEMYGDIYSTKEEALRVGLGEDSMRMRMWHSQY